MVKKLVLVAVVSLWLGTPGRAVAQVVVVRPWAYHPWVYRPVVVQPLPPVVPVYHPWVYRPVYRPYVYRPWAYRRW